MGNERGVCTKIKGLKLKMISEVKKLQVNNKAEEYKENEHQSKYLRKLKDPVQNMQYLILGILEKRNRKQKGRNHQKNNSRKFSKPKSIIFKFNPGKQKNKPALKHSRDKKKIPQALEEIKSFSYKGQRT